MVNREILKGTSIEKEFMSKSDILDFVCLFMKCYRKFLRFLKIKYFLMSTEAQVIDVVCYVISMAYINDIITVLFERE